MKRILLSILVLAAAFPAAAQVPEPGDPPHPAMTAARHAVISFLQLDAAQVDAWDVLWADHRADEQPLRQQIADLQAEIDALFAAGVPDPAELGLLVVERHDLGVALADVHRFYVDGFEDLLDAEQADRLREIRIADRIEPWIPSFKAFELVRR